MGISTLEIKCEVLFIYDDYGSSSILKFKFEFSLTQRNLHVHSIPLNVHVNTVHSIYAFMLKHVHLTLWYSDWGKKIC